MILFYNLYFRATIYGQLAGAFYGRQRDPGELGRAIGDARGCGGVIAALLKAPLAIPEMDGYEVLKNVRRLEPELGPLPVIAFTVAARDEDRAATRLAGFQAHLAKSIEPDKLVRTVLELFSCKKDGKSAI